MGLLDILDENAKIEARKRLNEIIRIAQQEAKPTKCPLCGKEQTSFCKSHSIPRMVLNTIKQNGYVLSANSLIGIDLLNTEDGIKNAGVFYYICNDCDNRYFQDYENADNMSHRPTGLMMAEIALKNALQQLSKRTQEKLIYRQLQDKILNWKMIEKVHDWDIQEYTEEIHHYQNIIDDRTTDEFDILFWDVLPYTAPIAAQTMVALPRDLKGKRINSIFNKLDITRMQYLHLCIFPLASSTVVLAFYNKRDKKYKPLAHQFETLPENLALKYFNWFIIEYTENYFLSKSIEDMLKVDIKLQKLSQENNGFPHLGQGNLKEMLFYKPIGVEDVTNLLDEKYAVRNYFTEILKEDLPEKKI